MHNTQKHIGYVGSMMRGSELAIESSKAANVKIGIAASLLIENYYHLKSSSAAGVERLS